MKRNKKKNIEELEGPKVDVKKVIKFTRKNWYWIGPVLKSGYNYLSKIIGRWKQKRLDKLNKNT